MPWFSDRPLHRQFALFCSITLFPRHFAWVLNLVFNMKTLEVWEICQNEAPKCGGSFSLSVGKGNSLSTMSLNMSTLEVSQFRFSLLATCFPVLSRTGSPISGAFFPKGDDAESICARGLSKTFPDVPSRFHVSGGSFDRGSAYFKDLEELLIGCERGITFDCKLSFHIFGNLWNRSEGSIFMQLLYLRCELVECGLPFFQFLPGKFVKSQFLSSVQFSHMKAPNIRISKCAFSFRQFFMKLGLFGMVSCKWIKSFFLGSRDKVLSVLHFCLSTSDFVCGGN